MFSIHDCFAITFTHIQANFDSDIIYLVQKDYKSMFGITEITKGEKESDNQRIEGKWKFNSTYVQSHIMNCFSREGSGFEENEKCGITQVFYEEAPNIRKKG